MAADNELLDRELSLALVRQSPDAIVFADVEGVIRVWNEAAERVFGFSAAEAIGKSLDIIIPERFRQAHWAGFASALSAQVTKYAGQAMATRSARADGAPIYVEMSFAIVTDSAGELLGALAQIRDITERFAKDRAARQRIKELEAALGKTP